MTEVLKQIYCHFKCFWIYKIVLNFNHPSLDHLLIMKPVFQSKLAVFYILHKVLPLYLYYFILFIMVLHPYWKANKKLDLIRCIIKINRCVPDYFWQYTDWFGELGCPKEKCFTICFTKTIPRDVNGMQKMFSCQI